MSAPAVVPVTDPAPVAVVPAPAGRAGLRLLRPTAQPAELIAAQNEARAFVKEVLKDGTDFGKIPGIDRPTLLKPGAEKVTLGFGCSAVPRIVEQEVEHEREVRWTKAKWVTIGPLKPDNWQEMKEAGLGRNRQFDGEWKWQEKQVEEGVSLGLYRYVVEVQIIDENGEIRGTGLGSCSTLESKYADRPRDCENTVLKMAVKRAHVAAVLSTFGLSDEFTQDVEESPVARDDAQQEGERANAGQQQRQQQGGTIGDPEDFRMPFGATKGQKLRDLDDKEITGAATWASEKGKFKEFIEAVRAVLLARRAARKTATHEEGEQRLHPTEPGPSNPSSATSGNGDSGMRSETMAGAPPISASTDALARAGRPGDPPPRELLPWEDDAPDMPDYDGPEVASYDDVPF